MSELFANTAIVTTVKTLIPWGFLILIRRWRRWRFGVPTVEEASRPPCLEEQKRMPIIAANGILVLIPSALYLSFKAQAGTFDAGFYAVQVLELGAGAVNIALLGLNMRDGLRMTGKLRRPA